MIIFLSFLNNEVLSQDYVPFPTEGAVWANNKLFGGDTVGTINYYINGDTLINGEVYHNLHATPDYIGSPNSFYKGAFREVDKIVFFREADEVTDDTLFNFNLLPGDTLRIETNDTGAPVVFRLAEIDSFLLQNNEYRRSYDFEYIEVIEEEEYTGFAFRWVEGIGCLLGLFYDPLEEIFPNGVREQMTCFSTEEAGMLYASPFAENCLAYPLSTIDVSANDSSNIRLFPNPAFQFLHFEVRSHIRLIQISIYNVYGQFFLGSDIYTTSEKKIDIHHLTPGTYLAVFQSSDGSFINSIFTKY